MTSVSVVVRTCNAGPRLSAHLVLFADYFAPYHSTYDFRYVIVDDASNDGTLEQTRTFARHRPNVTVIAQKRRRGLAHAFRTALPYVDSQYMILLDRSVQHKAAAYMELLETLEATGADVAVARSDLKTPQRERSRVARERCRRRCGAAVRLYAYRTAFLQKLSRYSALAHLASPLTFAAISADIARSIGLVVSPAHDAFKRIES